MPAANIPNQSVTQLSEKLRLKHNADGFPSFIKYIRFPRYRNLADGAKLIFDFPITALVGPNGGGKSSLLQALYGCPGYSNLGNFWFSTDVDPIVEGAGRPNCFIYGYKIKALNKEVEILKTRVGKEHNPNYWEPSRPIKAYGMTLLGDMLPEEEPYRTKTRWKTLEKQVAILDFRRTMGAYDRFFWLGGDVTPKGLEERKEIIRRRAPHLRYALDKNAKSSVLYRVERVLFSRPISANELAEASIILGREYIGGDYVRHKFYSIPGPTIRLKRAQSQYSDAFAGSGETAVFLTVMSVLNLNPGSLILLDEPETSLHPGAQERLLKFLMKESLKHGHQVVFSTHSPTMVKGLPSEAIKIMQETASGTFVINPVGSLSAAFTVLEHTTADEVVVLVEDELSAEIIRAGFRAHNVVPGIVGAPRIQVLPGGCNQAIQHVFPSSFAAGANPYLILDGDVLKQEDIKTPAALAGKTLQELKEHQNQVYGMNAILALDGGNDAAAKVNELNRVKDFLAFCHRRMGFLPRKSPDQLLLGTIEPASKDLGPADAKLRFVELAKINSGRNAQEQITSAEILFFQKLMLAKIIGDANQPAWWEEVLNLCAAIIQNQDLRNDLNFSVNDKGALINKNI